MLHPVLLPQLGQTMEEGTIEKWHKQEGDDVRKGEALYDLTTDKATLEVEAFASGTLRKILVPQGETVPVTTMVAVIGDPDEELTEEFLTRTALAPRQAQAAEGERPVAAERKQEAQPLRTGKTLASPRARKLAVELQAPLAALEGSGPGGRIIERDVLCYAERLERISSTATARAVAFEQGVDLVALARANPERRIRLADVEAAAQGAGARRVELSKMRRTIAQRMTLSKQTAPHFYLSGEVQMDAVQDFITGFRAETGQRVTVTAVLVKALALALKAHPRLNARYDDGGVALGQGCNVGVAVATEDGLFVPVIRDADEKDLLQIASELGVLGESARRGSLLPQQYEGGSITLTNLGMYGVASFLAIINPPESCIVAVGAITQKPIVREGEIVVAGMMNVSLSADHRVIDGAQAGEFFRTLRELLEEPDGLRE
ncbi:MAG: 2-oxo acid dehydrogenase subunit E2 [Planctomycetes bacterium]|nr:2-oxo acid dehydrogenase subunit E2 [Planctomycetota bacterium]